MGSSRDDFGSASFERASDDLVWAGHRVKDTVMNMEFSLPSRLILGQIKHIRTYNFAPDVYRVEYTLAANPVESTPWILTESGTEIWANAYHMRLATAAREAQKFVPKITETTRI